MICVVLECTGVVQSPTTLQLHHGEDTLYNGQANYSHYSGQVWAQSVTLNQVGRYVML